MKNGNSKIAKGLIDLFTIGSMIACFLTSDMEKGGHHDGRRFGDFDQDFSWGTVHSITSLVFTAFILIHIIQHWSMIKGIFLKNLYTKNVVTTITVIAFVVTVVSFLAYLTGFSHAKGEFHGTIANLFLITGSVHIVVNSKKFIALFREKLVLRESVQRA